MHSSLTQNSIEFHNAQSASPLPSKSTIVNGVKASDQLKNEEKRLDKHREGSPSSSSNAKPAFSYIALSGIFLLTFKKITTFSERIYFKVCKYIFKKL